MNVIELVTKYLPILDLQYRAESRSAVLDIAPEFVQETKDAKKVKLGIMHSDKLGSYSRHDGFAKGYAELTWKEYELTHDRGRSIQVDVMDNEESFGLAFGRLAGLFQREGVIPEIDAVRFSTYYKHAGTKKEFNLTSNSILKLIDDLDAEMDDQEVSENNRKLFVNPNVFKFMINDPSLVKHISVLDSEDKTVNKKIYMYDNHEIIKVPSKRFYTDIVELDGKTAGQETGGYVPAQGAQVIGLLMIQADAVTQIVKRNIARVWAPTRAEAAGTDGVNPDADAWKFDYRIYHDAWVFDEKINGIAGAICTGAGLGNVEVEANDTGVKLEQFGTTYRVKGTLPYVAADPETGNPAGNELDVTFKNPSVTAKSQLPDGVVVKSLTDEGTWREYTKDAFESDGSLHYLAIVNAMRVRVVQITWSAGNTTIYTFDTNGAALASA